MLRVAICDDDSNFLANFEKLLLKSFVSSGIELSIDKYMSGKNLISNIERKKNIYDLIFLDIEMPYINGLSVAKRLRELPKQSFYLIFITNMENEMSEGYTYKAFRFILKRRLEEDVKRAVELLLKELHKLDDPNEMVEFKYNNDGAYDIISVCKNDILYLEKDKLRSIWLYTIYGRYKLLVKALTDYEKLIDSKHFAIFVRNYLVNMNQIENYDDKFFIMVGNAKVPLGSSRQTIKESRERYMQFLTERI